MEPESPALDRPDDAVLEWIKSAAIPLATAEPGSGFDDLEPFRAIIGDARIVSLGEATHGTREFFKLKHRVLEFCVVELGFTMFGIEASLPDALDVNAYVLEGEGDPVEVAGGMGFWTWDTEEVVEMIGWLRRWNETAARKVKFYGFDMQSPDRALPGLVAYLDRVAPALARECAIGMAPLSSEFTARRFGKLPDAERSAVMACVARTLEAFDLRREEWVAATSALDWNLGRMHAVVLDQGARNRLGEDVPSIRDRSMAENALALLEAEGPGARAVLWSHNGHAGRVTFEPKSFAMGRHLDEWIGRAQVVIGFSFDRGAFQARGYPTGALSDHHVAGAPANSFDATLARDGRPLFALDLRAAPRDGAVAAILDSKIPMWVIGAGYGWPDRHYQYEWTPREIFDAVIFVAETTAARGNGPRDWDPARPAADAPTNLALLGEGVPWGWREDRAWRRHKHEIFVSDEPAPSGGRALRISREAAPWRWGEGELTQKIAAAPWRGKRVRFSGAIRTIVEDVGAGALLTLAWLPKPVEGEGEIFQQPFATFASASKPGRSEDWERVAVEAEVPEEADSIALGLLMAGIGDAWFGDLGFAAVGG